MSNNKVLTVSYGTFSCTLEGFEDSFDTMKAIAEYFRDLAADDRYFGAEPPQPDADMLARIAEKEIARRVQASHDEGRIVLSAAPQPAATPDPAPTLPSADSDAPTDDAATPAPGALEPEVAAEDPTDAAPAAQDADSDILNTIEEAIASDAPEAQIDAADKSDMDAEPEAEAETAPVAAGAVAATAAAVAGGTIADKLARIRAVVSERTGDDAAYSEDEHAEDMYEDAEADQSADADAADSLIAEVAAEMEAALDQDAATDAQTAREASSEDMEPQAEGKDDDVSAILARLGAEDAAEPVADPAEAPAHSDVPEESPEAPTDTPSDTPSDTGAAPEDAAPKPTKTAEPKRKTRVIKVKRADLEAAISSGALEEVAPEEAPAPESSLSDEDEEDLLRELAAVEAELPAPAAPEAETEAEAPDVDRLMAEADAQMDEPESAKNRDAFAHLRAAVAAKLSDDGIGEDAAAEEDQYKNDLDAVVKPRRPSAINGERAERPASRPAPLKLVAEQRVDTPQEGPVRPRRVATPDDGAAPSDADTFADYAEGMGAEGLPQLLEAAAAYLAFVENRDTFSRPQIMSKVRQVEGDNFSREDGLRSFGQLLRAGKIEKLKGGRFSATGDTGFRPGARRAS